MISGVHPLGESARLYRFFPEDPRASDHVLCAFRGLQREGIVGLHPAYASLLVEYDPLRLGAGEIDALVEGALARQAVGPGRTRSLEIPVLYGGEHGPDLEDV